MPNIKMQNFLGERINENFGDYLHNLNIEKDGKNFFNERKELLLKVINEKLGRLFGQKIDLSEITTPLNTTDHLGIMHHRIPMMTSIADMISKDIPRNYISFPGGKISLNNITQPFTLSVNGKDIDIFGYNNKKNKNHIISALDNQHIDSKKFKEFMDNIHDKANAERIWKIFMSEDMYDEKKYKGFKDQCLFINNELYKILIDESINYFFIDKYDISINYLIELLKQKDNPISIFLSSEKLIGHFLDTETYGGSSDLFRFIDNFKQRELKAVGSSLYYNDSHIIDLKDTENLINLLSNRKLIPSLPLMYIIFSLYPGIDCLGGIRQVYYLKEIQKKRIEILSMIGNQDEVEHQNKIITDKLIGGFEMIKTNKNMFDYIKQGERIDIKKIKEICSTSLVKDFI